MPAQMLYLEADAPDGGIAISSINLETQTIDIRPSRERIGLTYVNVTEKKTGKIVLEVWATAVVLHSNL